MSGSLSRRVERPGPETEYLHRVPSLRGSGGVYLTPLSVSLACSTWPDYRVDVKTKVARGGLFDL
jgi:hypothetical protein